MQLLTQYLTELSIGFSILILAFPLLFKKKFAKNHIASLAITAGIFGTFLGVFLGLLDFDTENITESVPKLIRGLQTAFSTSLAGLFVNLALRAFPSIYGFQEESTGKKSDDLGEQIVESLNKVAQSISGDGESSMVTQLQKIRTTNADGLEKMHTSFNEFAEKMIADNTQSLIDALTQVMQDFNTKINEQFGENFKRLNDAVGAMLEWQQEYKEQVELLTKQFYQIASMLKGVDESLNRTAKSHETIYQTNEILQVVVKDFSIQVASFAELGSQAKEAFPIIEKNMTSLTEATNKHVRDNLNDLKTNYESYTTTQKQLMEGYKNNIEKMITDNAERIKKLDTELGQELNKSLESLGSQLTSLSQHFVSDYKPLTESLKEVVQIAKGLN